VTTEHVDVLIIGAGLSGIGAAYHLQTRCPDRRYAIVEARAAMGGTWDLFRYPGVRSDSDMFTLGYRFRPWTGGKAITDGPSIKAYIEDTARAYGIDAKIRYGHRVVAASFSSAEVRWTVTMELGPQRERRQLTANFLYTCTGYYDYAKGYLPEWEGMADFGGRFVHPQSWPSDLDYSGKRVVVIGSGATAVTLVPAMAEGPGAAATVTMLQRSPTYVASIPATDGIANVFREVMSEDAAYAAARWKNILRQMLFFNVARAWPRFFRRLIQKGNRAELGAGFDVDTHFNPKYDPWDERFCIVPDGDLFRVLREGRAEIVTDRIERFDATGIALASGRHLEADIVVTATGLVVQLLGGMTLDVDGARIDLADTMAYRGMMYTGVPNLASAFGYTNASWTLKCDLTSEHVCRLLNYMDAKGFAQATPQREPGIEGEPVLDFTSGYVQRALPFLPKQGPTAPWRLYQNYIRDLFLLRYGKVNHRAIAFRRAGRAVESRDGSRAPDA
jgi:cation diffusion facilitator CzcD-associated flavoprotein CzcO